MKDLLLPLLHLAVTAAKLCRPGGVRAVIAENLLLKQQLIVLRRSRQRAPNLRVGDRLLCGFGALFLSPGRIRTVAIGLRPSTLLTVHQALVRGKYRRLFSSSARPKKPGPTGPSEALIRAIVELKSRNPSIRVPADCAHHLADVRGRHRQERRAPRAGETLSSSPGRNRALVVVVRRTHDRQSVERGPLALCVHRAPARLGARGHGPVHAAPRGSRCASRDRSMHPASAACATPPFMGGARRDISVRIMIRCSRRIGGPRTFGFWRSTKSRRCPMCPCHTPLRNG